ncbi:MAG: Anthranilate synthase [Chlorobi bacterium]|nr:Anthranilate synthase [Chlorobiota bacterium]
MNPLPDRAGFLAVATPGLRVPVVMDLPLGEQTPAGILARIGGETGFLLESGKGGRYSYIGGAAGRIWRSAGTHCAISGDDPMTATGDPFEFLRDAMRRENAVANPLLRNFSGGLVGYLAYDMARHIERLPELAIDDLHLPESCFLFIDRFYEIDHLEGRLRVAYVPSVNDAPPDAQYDGAVEILRAMVAVLERPAPAPPSHHQPAGPVESNMTPEEFAAIVGRAQEYIRAGDIFQANLSVRFSQRVGADPLTLYRALREVNPSPYMSCFLLPEMAIVSASPELLVKVRGGMLETRPIAGTRPRGGNREEDLANARELIENEKERAEHLMLVDLERNDIGRVARYGSVEVNEFMGIEEYSHVIHIVSNVRGELAEGRDTFDAIRACFPGGTITGAPKVRSMEIIEELEPCRRGLYTGAIGWIGFNGDAELDIAIRTIVIKDDIAYIQAGAGIVADSVPEREYAESVRKAEAALEAVRRAHSEQAVIANG